MMCTTETNYKISGIEDIEGREMVVRKNIAINETSLPMDRDLCAPHPWLTIFSTEKVDVNLSKSSVFKLQLIPQANASVILLWHYSERDEKAMGSLSVHILIRQPIYFVGGLARMDLPCAKP